MAAYSANMREGGSGHPDSTVMQDYSRQQRAAMLAKDEVSVGGWGLQIESSVSVAGTRNFAENSNSPSDEEYVPSHEEYVPSALNKDNQNFRKGGIPGNSHN